MYKNCKDLKLQKLCEQNERAKHCYQTICQQQKLFRLFLHLYRIGIVLAYIIGLSIEIVFDGVNSLLLSLLFLIIGNLMLLKYLMVFFARDDFLFVDAIVRKYADLEIDDYEYLNKFLNNRRFYVNKDPFLDNYLEEFTRSNEPIGINNNKPTYEIYYYLTPYSTFPVYINVTACKHIWKPNILISREHP